MNNHDQVEIQSNSMTNQKKAFNHQAITQWASPDGHFRRVTSTFRDQILTGTRFSPEKGRYHLYVSLACPWAHRTLIVRELKGLQSMIGISIVHPHMGNEGWSWTSPAPFNPNISGIIEDPIYSMKKIQEIYLKSKPDYDQRLTVPILFDRKHETIVNNESSEILRMLNSSFNDLLEEKYKQIDLYPLNLRKEIDEMNEWVYHQVNNGVYKAGFATNQTAYEIAVGPLFEALDRLEKILEGPRSFLIGDQMTEADVRLFTTIIRFDVVYVNHFNCNLKTIRANYPNLNHWLKLCYWLNPAYKETTNFEHIKYHYFTSHPQINPTRIIPLGPIPDIETLD